MTGKFLITLQKSKFISTDADETVLLLNVRVYTEGGEIRAVIIYQAGKYSQSPPNTQTGWTCQSPPLYLPFDGVRQEASRQYQMSEHLDKFLT